MAETSVKPKVPEAWITEGYYSGRYAFRLVPFTGDSRTSLCVVFAGQGAVYPGMFREAFDEFETVRKRFEEADRLCASLNLPAVSRFVTNPEGLSAEDRYRIQNLCLFVGEVGLFDTLVDKGMRPRAVTAHSFGEYAALVAAGVVAFEKMFRFVAYRESVSPPANARGHLIAVNGTPDEVAGWLRGCEFHLANLNSRSQTVIAVPPEEVAAVTRRLEEKGVRKKVLPTPQPYHSPLLDDMPPKFRAYLRSNPVGPKAPALHLVSSVVRAELSPERFDPKDIEEILTFQMTAQVDFIGQIQATAALGCDHYIEIGPTAILSPFIQESASAGAKVLPIDSYTRLSRRKRADASSAPLKQSKLWGSVNAIISRVTGYQIEDISLEDKFQEDLGIDSIKKTEIIFSVLEEVRGDTRAALDTGTIHRVKDLVAFLESAPTPSAADAPATFARYRSRWIDTPLVPVRHAEIPIATTVVRLGPALTMPAQSSVDLSDPARAWVLVTPGESKGGPPPISELKRALLATQRLLKAHAGLVKSPIVLVSSEPSEPIARGIAAFLKSLRKERDDIRFKWLRMDRVPDDTALRDLVARELEDPFSPEVSYAGGRRRVPVLAPEALPDARPEGSPVVLAVGGARGITFECLKFLCSSCRPRIVIWGRSPADADSVRDALTLLRAMTDVVEYQQVDASNGAAVRSALGQIAPLVGRVDLVLNGAGIERSESFQSRSLETVEAELAGKILPLWHLRNYLPPETRVFHFSSIVGEFGNRGQTVYALANGYAEALCERLDATAIAWPPWESVGMTNNPGIMSALRSQGVATLTPESAWELLRRELARPETGTVFYLSPHDPVAYGLPLTAHDRLPFLGKIKEASASGIVLSREITTKSDPYLLDHVVDKKPYLPGAVGAAWFLAMGMLAGRRAPALRDLTLTQPCIVGPEGQWLRLELARDGRVHLLSQAPHFSAILDREPGDGPLAVELSAPTARIDRGIYSKRTLFHGPSFQGFSRVDLHGDGGLSAELRPLPPILDRGLFGAVAQWIDLAFQGTALFGLVRHESMFLPVGVGRVELRVPGALRPPYRLRVKVSSAQADRIESDAVVLDAAGDTVLALGAIRLQKKEGGSSSRLRVKAL